MITKRLAEQLRSGQILLHVKEVNADKTLVRCRVNGKIKTWKRQPDKFRLPVKHGLKHCFYITERNGMDWTVA